MKQNVVMILSKKDVRHTERKPTPNTFNTQKDVNTVVKNTN